MNYRGGMLVGAVLLGGLWLGGDAVLAQEQPKKPDPKEEAKKKADDAKKAADEAKKRDDETRQKAEEQKKIARTNWDALEIGEPVFKETAHLLVHAPKSYKKIDATANYLEGFYTAAFKALGIKPKDFSLPGKVTVYLFTERDQFAAFRRRVEKQPVEPEDTSSMELGDAPHVSGSPPQSAGDLSAEGQAGEQIATLLLMKESADVQLPIWLTKGFGRATFYQLTPSSRVTIAERQQAYLHMKDKKYGAPQVFNNNVASEEAPILRGNLAQLMAYGPLAAKFSEFVAGYKPDKEKKQQMRNTDQALKAAGIEADALTKLWHASLGVKK